MWELLFKMVEPFIGYIVIAIGAVAGVGTVWLKGRRDGIRSEQNKALKEAYDAERDRQTVEDRVRNASDSDFERLRDHWVRPNQ